MLNKTFTFVLVSLAAVRAASADPRPALTDAQILGIVLAADDIDVAYGKLAQKTATAKDVRAFAEQMVNEHTTVQGQVKELAAKLKLKPVDSDTSAALAKQAKTVSARLATLQGDAFDEYYIANEVAYHEQVVGALVKVLIPSAHDKQLKAALEGAQPLFEGHLEHARNVAAGLTHGAHK